MSKKKIVQPLPTQKVQPGAAVKEPETSKRKKSTAVVDSSEQAWLSGKGVATQKDTSK